MLKTLGFLIAIVFGIFFLGIFFYETKADDHQIQTEGINLAELVSGSDDFDKYRLAFMEGARMLIADGKCTPQEIKNNGGWIKSTTISPNAPVYFTLCGGYKSENKIYYNASTLQIIK